MLSGLATLNANAASAQAARQPAPFRHRNLVYRDVIEGRPVVTMLDVGDLEPGRTHQLYFRGVVETPSGQHWHVSVTVARGDEARQARRPRERRSLATR